MKKDLAGVCLNIFVVDSVINWGPVCNLHPLPCDSPDGLVQVKSKMDGGETSKEEKHYYK